MNASPKPPPAFKQDLAQHFPTLRKRAIGLERDPAAADDLFQDTVERALRSWFRFRPGTNLLAWLLIIMRNRFIEQRRRWQPFCSSDRIVDPASDGPLEDSLDGPGEQSPDPGVLVESALEQLGTLPSKMQRTAQLVWLERCSYRVAGRTLGVSPDTVGSRLSRIRKRLRCRAQVAAEVAHSDRVSRGPGRCGR